MVASHEAAECATDPHDASSLGWVSLSAGEIGDVCVGTAYTLVSGTESYAVSRLWSNPTA